MWFRANTPTVIPFPNPPIPPYLLPLLIPSGHERQLGLQRVTLTLSRTNVEGLEDGGTAEQTASRRFQKSSRVLCQPHYAVCTAQPPVASADAGCKRCPGGRTKAACESGAGICWLHTCMNQTNHGPPAPSLLSLSQSGWALDHGVCYRFSTAYAVERGHGGRWGYGGQPRIWPFLRGALRVRCGAGGRG